MERREKMTWGMMLIYISQKFRLEQTVPPICFGHNLHDEVMMGIIVPFYRWIGFSRLNLYIG